MPLVVPAFELRLKKAELEIVRETLQDHSPLWWRGVDMVWGAFVRKEWCLEAETLDKCTLTCGAQSCYLVVLCFDVFPTRW